MTEKRLQRLATAVRARRTALGLAQGDLSSRGGPGVVTVGKIEQGKIQQPQPSTLERLDRALRWQPGSAAGVLAGQQPQELPANGQPVGAAIMQAIEQENGLLPIAKTHLMNQLELLLQLQQPLPDAVAEDQERRRQQAAVEQGQDRVLRELKSVPQQPVTKRTRKG